MVSASHPRRAGWRTCCALAASLATLLALTAADAEARPGRSAKRHVHKAKPAPAKTVKRSYGPLLAVVSLRSQKIAVYGSDGLITRSAVSTGQPGHPTPEGVFSVIQKRRFHRSNIYSAAPMPFMQRITWSGVALHAGVVPGYPASHGCIRLNPGFATELWRMTRVGTRVVVSPDDVAARELTHAALPVPLMTPEPDKVAARPEGALVRTASAGGAASDASPEPGKSPPRLLNPLERAQAAKVRAAAEASARAKAAKDAHGLAAAKAAEGKQAIAALRKADIAAAAARARLEAAEKAVARAKTPDALERATAVRAAAQTMREAAEKAAAEAARDEDSKTFEAFNAARAAWNAEEAATQAVAAKEAAERGVEPISIFISKKAGRIFVRQDWAPVYDAPVTFKQPELPLGTHLLLATAPLEDGKAMRWLAVSMPTQEEAHRRGQRDQGQAPASRRQTSAAEALDRVELGAEARAFIEDRLWTGAALIVSDFGLSEETGKTTDFIVLTR